MELCTILLANLDGRGCWGRMDTCICMVGSLCVHLKHHNIVNQLCVCVYVCLVAQSCPTLCDSVDCSPPGSSVHGSSPGKNTAVVSHFLLQGIFPTQGLNLGLPHYRRILYCLSHQLIGYIPQYKMF